MFTSTGTYQGQPYTLTWNDDGTIDSGDTPVAADIEAATVADETAQLTPTGPVHDVDPSDPSSVIGWLRENAEPDPDGWTGEIPDDPEAAIPDGAVS